MVAVTAILAVRVSVTVTVAAALASWAMVWVGFALRLPLLG